MSRMEAKRSVSRVCTGCQREVSVATDTCPYCHARVEEVEIPSVLSTPTVAKPKPAVPAKPWVPPQPLPTVPEPATERSQPARPEFIFPDEDWGRLARLPRWVKRIMCVFMYLIALGTLVGVVMNARHISQEELSRVMPVLRLSLMLSIGLCLLLGLGFLVSYLNKRKRK